MGLRLWPGLALFSGLFLFSCFQDADSTPQFVFKPALRSGLAAKVGEHEITAEAMAKGIESKIYDLKKKLYDLQYHQLKSLMIKHLITREPGVQGRSASEFLAQEVTGKVEPTKRQIDEFIKERKIPKKHHSEQLLTRVKAALTTQLKEQAADKWLAKKSRQMPIEIYLERPERPFFAVSVGDAPVTGGKNAKVTIVEFSDFECRYCSRGAEVLKKIQQKFGNKVRVAFKHFPLPRHAKAKGAANAAMCAYEQSRPAFWKLHDLMFENQTLLDPEGLKGLAKKVSLDIAKFEQCMGAKRYMTLVEKNIAEGRAIGVKSTPTFFVNGRIINGAQPLEVFVQEIQQHL